MGRHSAFGGMGAEVSVGSAGQGVPVREQVQPQPDARHVTTLVKSTPAALGDQGETLFGCVEEGQPRSKLPTSATYDVRRFTFVARTQHFGAVTVRNPVGQEALDQMFGAKWISDVSVGFRPVPRLTLSAGADNVFDVYPDQNNNLGSVKANYGIFPYNQFSPFGFNGRFLYTRVRIGL